MAHWNHISHVYLEWKKWLIIFGRYLEISAIVQLRGWSELNYQVKVCTARLMSSLSCTQCMDYRKHIFLNILIKWAYRIRNAIRINTLYCSTSTNFSFTFCSEHKLVTSPKRGNGVACWYFYWCFQDKEHTH